MVTGLGTSSATRQLCALGLLPHLSGPLSATSTEPGQKLIEVKAVWNGKAFRKCHHLIHDT